MNWTRSYFPLDARKPVAAVRFQSWPFHVRVDRSGVELSGPTTAVDGATARELARVLRRAARIHEALLEGRPIPRRSA